MRFLRWLDGIPGRLISIFPFTKDGRQTLIYLLFAFSGPALTLLVWWAMRVALAAKLNDVFASLADKVALCLLITCLGFAMFISIRSFKIGKDGLEADSGEQGGN